MLSTNWTIGSSREAGRAYVIRNKIGRAPARKSQATHAFLTAAQRIALCDKLERDAARK